MNENKATILFVLILCIVLSCLAVYVSQHMQDIINWFKQQGNWTYYQQIIFC